MTKRFAFSAVLPFLLLSQACTPEPQPPAPAVAPKLILHHARVFTATGGADAEAVAVGADGKYAAVGTNAEVLALAGPDTQVVDMSATCPTPGVACKVLLPTWDDAHTHMVGFNPSDGILNDPAAFLPGDGPTLEQVQALFRQALAAQKPDGSGPLLPKGSRLVAYVGTSFLTDAAATRDALDSVCGEDYLCLARGWSGHGTVAASPTLTHCGLSDTQPDIPGGYYERDASGRITGKLHEAAEIRFLRCWIGEASDEQLAGLMKAYATTAVKYGVGRVQDMSLGMEHARAVRVTQLAQLPLRARVMCLPGSEGEACTPFDSPTVQASGTKRFADGTPFERAGCTSRPYQDAPWTSGHCNWTDAELESFFRQQLAQPAGPESQVLVHAMGDKALTQVLDAMEATGGAAAWKGRRLRVEHGTMLYSANDVARASALGVYVSQQGNHLAFVDPVDGVPSYAKRFEGDIFVQMDPIRSLATAGLHLNFGTDGVGFPISSYLDLALTTTHPMRPGEALPMREALVAYTRGSAESAFDEDKRGSIQVGLDADFQVPTVDVLQEGLPFTAVASAMAHATFIAGKPVWDDGSLTPEGGWRQ
ncbi:amidohydrolase [Archangium primigenium]|uniref:amidohydrolase n=1 Tax=[Archangium] primigenium TaxID=2792470 RepID=UPI00195C0302|nr:amidohydrolase family protein [Archangium primigenium]MBM7117618.1 amidohydrolase family protein [Archangium primigenium]